VASSADLKQGQTVYVIAGPLKGSTGPVIDPKAVADGLPNQRKVLISLGGEATFILPRLLSTELPSTPVAKEAPTRCRACNGIGWILP